jgi:hypothetical protein
MVGFRNTLIVVAVWMLQTVCLVSGCPYLLRSLTDENKNGNDNLDASDCPGRHTNIRGRDDRNLQEQQGPPPFECPLDDTSDTVSSVKEVIALAKQDILNVIQSDPRRLGPKFLRLGFHDCIGGCDGSINLMDDPENAGLQIPVQVLRPLVNCYSEWLTRADIWALATLTAAEALQQGGGGGGEVLPFPLEWVGRLSMAQDDTGGEEQTPSAHLTTSELFQFFDDEFGFTPDEAVALMGAHSM